MSVFSNLKKSERRAVFSGENFPGAHLPSGQVMPDGTVLVHTKEGVNTFELVSVPARKSRYGSNSIWRCDVARSGNPRIADRAVEIKEVVVL